MDELFNDKDIQQVSNRDLEYDEDIEACLNLLEKKFAIQNAPCPAIESFLLYKQFESVAVVGVYKSSAGEMDVAFYQLQYSWASGAKYVRRHYDQCFLALLTLGRSYPRTCITKETLQTRINDWFTKQDVDFIEQKKFSKMFHVATRDKQKLTSMLYDQSLDELTDFPEMEAEIWDNYCLFKESSNPASEYRTEQLIALTKTLHRVLRWKPFEEIMAQYHVSRKKYVAKLKGQNVEVRTWRPIRDPIAIPISDFERSQKPVFPNIEDVIPNESRKLSLRRE